MMSLISLQISQFIPIILTFLFLRYTNISVIVSHSILGKLFAVALIVFYSRIDPILGLFVCLFVIYYYQTDFVEGMKTEDDDDEKETDSVKDSKDIHDVLESGPVDENMKDPDTDPDKNQDRDQDTKADSEISETFANYESSYQTGSSIFAGGPGADAPHPCPKKQKFMQQHCEHRTLKYKNQPVRPDITEHVFTEISFNDTPCNICEKGCMYNITSAKLDQEEVMRRPTGGLTSMFDGGIL